MIIMMMSNDNHNDDSNDNHDDGNDNHDGE